MWGWAFGAALVAGLVVGGLTNSDEGFWLATPFGFGIGLLIGMARSISALRRRLEQVERSLAQREAASPASPPAETEAPPLELIEPEEESRPGPATTFTEPTARQADEEKETVPAAATTPEGKAEAPGTAVPDMYAGAASREEWGRPAASTGPDPVERLVRRVWDFFTGDNAVVRVGLLVLFFGVAFLYRYGVERGAIPVEWNFILVALAAIGVLFWGWRLRDSRPGFSLLVQGGAIGVLYLTVFSAARLYHLLPMELAFFLMVGLVLLSTALALLQESMALAVAGAAGGFLAPILASTGEGSHVVLFGYYALLDLGIAAIAWHRAWRPLNLLGFVFTLVIGALWGQRYYRPEYFATTEPFLLLFFLIFSLVGVLYAFRQPPRLRGYIDSALIFGTPLTAFTLQWSLVRDLEYGAALSALALALYYTGLARWLWRRTRQDPALRPLTEAFLALAVAFATLAIPLALSGRWTSVAWVLEGAAMVWVGLRQQRLLATAAGLLLQVLAGLAFFGGEQRLLQLGHLASTGKDVTPLLNSAWLGGSLIAAAGLFTGWWLYRRRHQAWPWTGPFQWPALLWGTAWWLGSGLSEINRLSPGSDHPAFYLLFIAVSLAALRRLGRRLHWPAAELLFAVLLPVLAWVLGWQWSDHHLRHPFADYGWIAWPAAWLLWYHGLRRMERLLPEEWRIAAHCLGLWLLSILVASELSWQLLQLARGSALWPDLAWGLVPMAVIEWLGLRRWGSGWPFTAQPGVYHGGGLHPLALWCGLWIGLTALFHAGNPAPLPYLPLLNPLELVHLAGFTVLLRWGLRWWGGTGEGRRRLWRVAGTGLFLWVNTVLARAVHHLAGVPWDLGRLLESLLFQAALSVLWGALGLVTMLAGSRLHHRALWQTGLGLYALTVAKLFLVDLAHSDTIERIVSFLAVGSLLVATGYFAPRPAAATRGETVP